SRPIRKRLCGETRGMGVPPLCRKRSGETPVPRRRGARPTSLASRSSRGLFLRRRGGGRLGGHLGVEGEKGFEALGVVFEAAADVDAFESLVVAVVGGAQIGRHFVGIVEIGDGGGEMRLAGEQDVFRATRQV